MKIREINMNVVLQVDFSFTGPFGSELANSLTQLAHSINLEPGMIWKIWTENKETQEAGGVYLFESQETAKAYLEMHTARLKEMGIAKVVGKVFDVNERLSKINNGPITSF